MVITGEELNVLVADLRAHPTKYEVKINKMERVFEVKNLETNETKKVTPSSVVSTDSHLYPDIA